MDVSDGHSKTQTCRNDQPRGVEEVELVEETNSFSKVVLQGCGCMVLLVAVLFEVLLQVSYRIALKDFKLDVVYGIHVMNTEHLDKDATPLQLLQRQYFLNDAFVNVLDILGPKRFKPVLLRLDELHL